MTHPLYQRPTSRFPLPSGHVVTLQPLSELEWEEVARLCRREDGTTSNALAKAHTILFGLVDPKPGSVEDVQNMRPADRDAVDEEIAYLSEIMPRPEVAAAEAASDDAGGKEAEADPLVEEFPVDGIGAVAEVVGDPGVVSGVSLPAESVAGGDAGHVSDDSGGREGASGTQPPVAN